MSPSLEPLRRFVTDFADLLDRDPDEVTILARGRDLLGRLIADDAWLPATHAAGANGSVLFAPAAVFTIEGSIERPAAGRRPTTIILPSGPPSRVFPRRCPRHHADPVFRRGHDGAAHPREVTR